MTDLERRALMGDKKAQEECTEKGIVLPCPKCFNTVEVKKYDDVIFAVKCQCGLSYMPTSMEEQNKFPESWNTRSAPPIGRCGECKHSTEPSHLTTLYGEPGTLTCHYGPCNRRNVNANDYCSYFEPRCEE